MKATASSYLALGLIVFGCSDNGPPSGSSAQSGPAFGIAPASPDQGLSSFTRLQDPPVVAGASVSSVGLLATGYQLHALGVDKLGGITTLGSTPFSGAKAELFLERFTSSGARAWSRHGVCNRALGALNLFVNDSGQSLFSAGFSDGCNWEGSVIRSALNPAPVADPFILDQQTEAGGPSEDAFLVAHSDHGTNRGFAQVSGAGRQSVRALFPLPQASEWLAKVDDEASAPPDRGDVQVGVLLDFEAKALLGERSILSSSGGVGADSLCTRAQAAPLGSESDASTELGLELGEGLHLEGTRIERIAAREDDVLLAGKGALPTVLPDADAEGADASGAIEHGWLAALSATGEVTELAHWLPAIAPSSLAVAPDGSIYAAFDHGGLQLGELEPAADAGSTAPSTPPAYHLVRFDADGAVQWQQTFKTQAVHSVHLAATNVAVALWGSHLGSVDVDGIIAPSVVGDTANALVMSLNPDGSIVSVQHWGQPRGVDGAYMPRPHPAGGFIGILNLSTGDDMRSLSPGSYLLWVPN